MMVARLPRLHPPPVVVRYQRERPGELCTWTRRRWAIGRVGHRVHDDHARRAAGIGWEVLYAAIAPSHQQASGHSGPGA